MRFIVSPVGSIRAIYSDEAKAVLDGAGLRGDVRRASHVEPDEVGDWYADLSPVGGPRLESFPTRRAALDAEVAWLNDHNIPTPSLCERS